MRSLIIATAFALFLTACSGAGDTEDSPGASDEGLALSDFIPGAVGFDQAGDEDEYYRQQERVAQEKIAACMAEQGFEYIAYVRGQDQDGFSMPDTQEEFVARYGFGIATMILENQPPDEETMKAEIAKDPNNAIIDAMADTERDAYYAALYGEQPEDGLEEPTEDSPGVTVGAFEPSGCQNAAYEEAFNQGAEVAFYEQFGPLMEDMYAGVESDPRIVGLEGTWSSCMAEKGYEFADRNEAQVFLLRRLEEVGAITDLEIDPGGMGWGYGGGEVEPGSPVEAAVKEIAAEEIAMAKVSFACSADEQKVRQEVYQEAEQRFIRENLAELERYKKEHP